MQKMRTKKYIFLVAVIFFGFWCSSWIAALSFPSTLSMANKLPPNAPKRNLTPVDFTKCEEIRAIADKQEAEIILQIRQQHEQIKSIVAVPRLVDRILREQNLPDHTLTLLAEIKKDPKALDKRTAKQLSEVKVLKQQALGQCRLD
jgi:hypothetical protein